MKVVVGLGNPGKKYEGTRHNVGFDVLNELAQRFSAVSWNSNFEAITTEIMIGSEKVLLVAPQTFMNLSGRSVRAVVNFFKLPLTDLLLVYDDINLPTGKLRLRSSGSAGGQKGLKNTIDQLGTEEFARLRVGIDRPSGNTQVVDHVLQKFTKAERNVIDDSVYQAASAVECWSQDGIDAAMNRFNMSESSP